MKTKIFKLNFSFLERLKEKLNAYITNTSTVIHATRVIFQARSLAGKNLPAISDPSLEPFLGATKGAYKQLKKEVSINLQGGVQKTLGMINVSTSNQKIGRKNTELGAVKEKGTHLMIDRDSIYLTHDEKGYRRGRFFTQLFALGEILWTSGAFLKIGDIVIIAFVTSMLIGIAQVSAIKTQTLIIRESEDQAKKWKQIMFTALAAVAFSVILGLIRYWFVHSSNGATIPFIIINPFTFAAINLLFMVATGLIVYFYYPNREELKKINDLKKINAEIEKIKKEREVLEAQLRELEKERELLSELRLIIQHAEQILHERIDSLYEEAVGVFKHENTVKRTDGIFPICFTKPHEPLGKTGTDNLLFT